MPIVATSTVSDALQNALQRIGTGKQVKMTVSIVLKNSSQQPPTNPIDWLVGTLNQMINLSQLQKWPDSPQVVSASSDNPQFGVVNLEFRFILDSYAADYLPRQIDATNLEFGRWMEVKNDAGAYDAGFDIIYVDVSERQAQETPPSQNPPSANPPSSSGGKPWWVWVALVLAGTLVLVGLRKQR